MKADIIKWDESMAVRCLERSWRVEANTVADTRGKNTGVYETGSSFDRQWAEFEKALSKALQK